MNLRLITQGKSVPHEEAGFHILLYEVRPGKAKSLGACCARYTWFRPIESGEVAGKEWKRDELSRSKCMAMSFGISITRFGIPWLRGSLVLNWTNHSADTRHTYLTIQKNGRDLLIRNAKAKIV